MLKKILACFCLTLALLVGVTEPNLTQAQAAVPVRTITKAQVEPLPAKVRIAIYLDAWANGGGTYDQNGVAQIFKDGYFVSLTDNVRPATFVNFNRQWREMQGQLEPGQYLGTLKEETMVVDPVTHKQKKLVTLCVDISLHVQDKEEAMRIDRKYHQRSIYDCAHGTILEVEYGRKQAAI